MSEDQDRKPTCGVVMPISAIDDCSEAHWSDVLEILTEAIDDAGFEANLVSNADDVGIIQKRIIQNLYDNPIVVCDVSGKNPNVMFELGMRLAFDRPTIIIKDNKTSYSFDTSPIEHLEYPRDLRFSKIVEFKDRLADKVKKTYEKSTTDASYTTFLKNFGEFKVAKIDQKEVSGQEFILDELKTLRQVISRMERSNSLRKKPTKPSISEDSIVICLVKASQDELDALFLRSLNELGVSSIEITKFNDHKHLRVVPNTQMDEAQVIDTLKQFLPRMRVKDKTKPIRKPTLISDASSA